MIFIVSIFILTFVFLIRWNFKIQRILKQDKTMFRMAELRRNVVLFLREKWKTLSKSDGEKAINLIQVCSFTISNHRDFYSSFKIHDIIVNLSSQKKEVDEAELYLNQAHNKRIKSMYTKFGIILLENIKDYTFFFRFKLVFALLKGIVNLMFSQSLKNNLERIENYQKWLESQDSQFSKYEEKYYTRYLQ